MRYVKHLTGLNFKVAILFVLLISSIVFLNPNQNSLAIDTPTNLKGLTLSPLRTELNIEPGTALDGKLKVTNNSSKPMLVTLNAEVFRVINQQYDYAFTAESNVVKWVSFNRSEVNLEPGKSENITFTVGVPLTAEPGGRYISLFASTDTDTTTTSIESKQRIASLLYITVMGDVSRVGHLVSLSSPWLISGDSTWSAALQNTGTTHYRSRYNLQIKDLFFDNTIAKMSGEALILPGTVRLISDTLPTPFWPGLYKAVYNIGLGDNPAIVKTSPILYMPIWVMVAIVILAITIIYWLNRKKFGKKI